MSAERKTCTKCGEVQPLSAFHRMSTGKDGHRPNCKACVLSARATYRTEHPDKVRNANALWVSKNKQRVRQHKRRHYQANREAYYASAARRRARLAGADHEPYDRAALFERWGYLCCYCDAKAEHVEHIQPISRGGADALRNLTVACQPCNYSKGAKTLAEWALTF